MEFQVINGSIYMLILLLAIMIEPRRTRIRLSLETQLLECRPFFMLKTSTTKSKMADPFDSVRMTCFSITKSAHESLKLDSGQECDLSESFDTCKLMFIEQFPTQLCFKNVRVPSIYLSVSTQIFYRALKTRPY